MREPTPARRRLEVLPILHTLLLVLLVGLPNLTEAEGRSVYALSESLKARVEEAALGDGVGISIVDMANGQKILDVSADTPRNPASNMKVFTAAISLLELGADYRFRTGLYGRTEGDAVVGGLYLRGFADPLLDSGDLAALAGDLVQRGIRKVDELLVDGSFFDDQVLPPAFEQQPDEVAPFRAPVGAVSVNRNAYTLRVLPGASAESPGRVRLEGAAYFVVDNALQTVDSGRLNVIAIQRESGDTMDLKLRGTVPRGIAGASYRRRVEHPLLFAGHVMVEALRTARIQVPLRVSLAPTPTSAGLLAQHVSPPLSQVLQELGKYSDNFVAEMVLKTLGAEKKGSPGTSAHGVEVVMERLHTLGVDTTGLKIVNGSGLFDGNEVAPTHLTQLLLRMKSQPQVYPEFLSQLAVGGRDGTLSRRLTDLPTSVVVRAKTGTLNDVIALSGYVLGKTPGEGYAFSFLANGVRGRHHAARSLADDLVRLLAHQLEKDATSE